VYDAAAAAAASGGGGGGDVKAGRVDVWGRCSAHGMVYN